MINKNLVATLDKCGRVHIRTRKKFTQKMKVVIRKNSISYNYNINNKMIEEIFPLQLGNGTYTITLYKNVNGNKYSAEGQVSIKLKIENSNLPFLYPNQYVNYNNLKISEDIINIDTIKDYIVNNFKYDYVRAIKVKTNELPDITTTLEKKMGICQDLAAVFVAFCREKKIPAKLVIGTADTKSHAWCEYYENNNWHFFDPTGAIQNHFAKKYIVQRYY